MGGMDDAWIGIEALIDEAEPVGREALALFFELKPGLRESYDARSMHLAREDMAQHVRQLAAIILAKDGGTLVDYLSWLKVLFDARRIPDEHIVVAFRCVGRAASRRLDPDSARLFGSYAERAAREYGRSDPATNRYLKEGLPENGMARAYVQALLEGRRDLAEALVKSERQGGITARQLYLELFEPAMRELGRLWQLGKINIAQEHFATAATQYLMSGLYAELFGSSRPGGRKLIAACAQGELHELGLRMVADFFQAEGWDARYLGANLPISALVQEQERSPADLIALSATLTTSVRCTALAIEALRAMGGPRIPVMVGGHPFIISPDLCGELGADGTAPDCETAVRVGSLLLGPSPGA
jgi:MerR family transcriptional regulator, light-induced transcriptional regulator